MQCCFHFGKQVTNKQDQGTDRMKKIGKAMMGGFLRAEYRVLAYFCCSCSRSITFLAPEGKNSWLVSVFF